MRVGGSFRASRNEMGPTTEETVLPLLEFLVDPLLPAVTRNKAPSPAQEESVAKQVQAVVLLYDYYHRKQHPELMYLDFVSFCKLAVVLKPSLLSYMKVTQKTEFAEVEDLNKQLSLTEKLVKEACDVSDNLCKSKGGVTGWPIAKVAVFLVDFSKENCFLLHSSNTQGVWSVIEKEHTLNIHPEGIVEEKGGRKKKRVIKKPLKENRNLDEHGLQQLAFEAVKSSCGCSQSDLKILESHVVYSLSKVKTTARFYIMQCKQSNQEESYLPIRYALESLQGPLVRKESRNWLITPTVEYFPLLPYSEILSDWFSREFPSEALHITKIIQKNNGDLPTNSTHEDKDRDQRQTDVLGSDEVGVPCLMSEEQDLHAQKLNAGTDACKPLKIDSGQDMCISYSLTPVDTQVHIVRESESGDRSKEEVRDTSCSELKSDNLKGVERAEELVEAVVCKKRNKSLKRDSVGDDAGCKLSDAAVECSKKGDESSVSSLSNDMEIDQHVPVACSKDGKIRSLSGQERVSPEIKAIVLSQNSLPCPTTVNANKEELVDTTPNNHQQNGKIIDAEVKAGSSCQEVPHNALVPFHSDFKEVDAAPSGHGQNGNNTSAEVKAGSSCQEVPHSAFVPFHSDFKEVDAAPSGHGQNGNNTSAEVKAGSSCQEVPHNALVPFHSDSKEVDATPSGHGQNGNNTSAEVRASSSCKDLPCSALVPFHSDSKDVVNTTSSTHGPNRKYINAEAKAGPPCQEVLHDALVPFHSDSKDIPDTKPSGHVQNGNNADTLVKGGSSHHEVLHNALVPFHSDSKEVDKLRNTLCPREKLISQAALKVLRKKRDTLSHQLRSLEDEIALCDGQIQTILSGSEDCLAVKLDAIIEGCSFENLDSSVPAHKRMYQPSRDQDSPNYSKRTRLSEANISRENSCQELDDICHENCWTLPTYSISTSDGAFQSAVTVKGTEFEWSCKGGVGSTPRESRESAASAALTRMRDNVLAFHPDPTRNRLNLPPV